MAFGVTLFRESLAAAEDSREQALDDWADNPLRIRPFVPLRAGVCADVLEPMISYSCGSTVIRM
jgi:hypothetical protein